MRRDYKRIVYGVGPKTDQRSEQGKCDQEGDGGLPHGIGGEPPRHAMDVRRGVGLGRVRHGLDLFHFRPAEEARWHEDQNDGEDGERRHILVLRREIACPEHFDQPDGKASQHRARKGADAPQHSRREGLDARDEADKEIDNAVIDEEHQPRHSGKRRANDESERDRAVHVHAAERRHLAILLAGALRAAKRGAADDEREHRHQNNGCRDDEDLHVA